MRTHSLALSLGLLAAAVATDASGAATNRSYVAGSYQVLIDGQPVAWVAKVSGGGATADVVTEKAGQTGAYPKKHAGAVKYEDIALTIDGPMERGLHDWVKQTLATAQSPSKSGAIVSLDASFKEVSRTSWTQGVISDFSFPELDAASRDRAPVFVTIAPAFTRLTQGGGAVQASATGLKSRAMAPLASNFRLTISGLESATVATAHIEPMSVRFTQATSPVGEMRDYEKTPGKVDVSNLAFTVAEGKADPIVRWHEDFVVKGNNSDANEKTGSSELLASDLKTVLYKLNMKGIGILKYSADKSSTDTVRRMRVECYVESVSLD